MSNKFRVQYHTLSMREMLESNNIFYVPPYQRRYSWEKKQLEDLWNDVYSLGKKNSHFLGNIVIVPKAQPPMGPNRLEIIDGQQRLVCVSVLLIAIRDYLKDQGENKRVETFRQMLYNFSLDGDYICDKLELGSLDEEDYKYLVNIARTRIKYTKVKNDCLRRTYEYFMLKIKEMGIEKTKEFHEKLVKKVSATLITVTEDLNAYTLFEGLNNRGLRLSPVDLMKNRLFQASSEAKDGSLESVKDLWSHIITNLDGIGEERFFRQYMMSSKAFRARGKVTVTGLYKQFRKNLKSACESCGIEAYIRDIEESSELYSRIWHGKINEYGSNSRNEIINVHLRNLDDIGAIPSYTLLLRMFKENVSREDVIKILELIEKFTIRRIVGSSPTRELDTIYNHLAHNAFEKREPVEYIQNYLKARERIPSDNEFKEKFEKIDFKNNSQTKYILGEIELRHFRDLKTPNHYSSYDVHIEHIAPRRTYTQKSKTAWKKYLGIDKDKFNKYKSKIGNLTALEGLLNKKAKYKSFDLKKKYYAQSDFKMAKKLCTYERWSIEKINKRTEKLAKIATKVWKL